MKRTMIPVEVIAHFDTLGKITPYRIRYEKDDTTIIKITRLLKRDINTFAGNPVEVYECVACNNGQEVIFSLNYEKKLNKWFLTKI